MIRELIRTFRQGDELNRYDALAKTVLFACIAVAVDAVLSLVVKAAWVIGFFSQW